MNRTKALAQASRAVSMWGSGTSWTVCCPYYRADIAGPSTEIGCSSYAQARLTAARIRAGIALTLLGEYTDDAAAELYRTNGSARDMVAHVLEVSRDHSFRRATVNGERGWIVTRRNRGVFVGRAFGRTRAAAVAAFDTV
jgi:hypothetical protein